MGEGLRNACSPAGDEVYSMSSTSTSSGRVLYVISFYSSRSADLSPELKILW